MTVRLLVGDCRAMLATLPDASVARLHHQPAGGGVMAKRVLPPNDVLVALYRSGLSGPQIAERYSVAPCTVTQALKRAGEPRRSAAEASRQSYETGRNAPARYWLGKRQSREHVEARVSKIRGDQHWLWKGGTSDRREYRGVVTKEQCERCGGQDRLAIHHRNLDHYDNAPENLAVLCVSCHSSIHKQAYWDAVHAGEPPPKSNAPINWRKGGAKTWE